MTRRVVYCIEDPDDLPPSPDPEEWRIDVRAWLSCQPAWMAMRAAGSSAEDLLAFYTTVGAEIAAERAGRSLPTDDAPLYHLVNGQFIPHAGNIPPGWERGHADRSVQLIPGFRVAPFEQMHPQLQAFLAFLLEAGVVTGEEQTPAPTPSPAPLGFCDFHTTVPLELPNANALFRGARAVCPNCVAEDAARGITTECRRCGCPLLRDAQRRPHPCPECMRRFARPQRRWDLVGEPVFLSTAGTWTMDAGSAANSPHHEPLGFVRGVQEDGSVLVEMEPAAGWQAGRTVRHAILDPPTVTGPTVTGPDQTPLPDPVDVRRWREISRELDRFRGLVLPPSVGRLVNVLRSTLAERAQEGLTAEACRDIGNDIRRISQELESRSIVQAARRTAVELAGNADRLPSPVLQLAGEHIDASEPGVWTCECPACCAAYFGTIRYRERTGRLPDLWDARVSESIQRLIDGEELPDLFDADEESEEPNEEESEGEDELGDAPGVEITEEALEDEPAFDGSNETWRRGVERGNHRSANRTAATFVSWLAAGQPPRMWLETGDAVPVAGVFQMFTSADGGSEWSAVNPPANVDPGVEISTPGLWSPRRRIGFLRQGERAPFDAWVTGALVRGDEQWVRVPANGPVPNVSLYRLSPELPLLPLLVEWLPGVGEIPPRWTLNELQIAARGAEELAGLPGPVPDPAADRPAPASLAEISLTDPALQTLTAEGGLLARMTRNLVDRIRPRVPEPQGTRVGRLFDADRLAEAYRYELARCGQIPAPAAALESAVRDRLEHFITGRCRDCGTAINDATGETDQAFSYRCSDHLACGWRRRYRFGESTHGATATAGAGEWGNCQHCGRLISLEGRFPTGVRGASGGAYCNSTDGCRVRMTVNIWLRNLAALPNFSAAEVNEWMQHLRGLHPEQFAEVLLDLDELMGRVMRPELRTGLMAMQDGGFLEDAVVALRAEHHRREHLVLTAAALAVQMGIYNTGQIEIGTINFRPEPGLEGRLYLALDEGSLWADNGEAWDALALLDDGERERRQLRQHVVNAAMEWARNHTIDPRRTYRANDRRWVLYDRIHRGGMRSADVHIVDEVSWFFDGYHFDFPTPAPVLYFKLDPGDQPPYIVDEWLPFAESHVLPRKVFARPRTRLAPLRGPRPPPRRAGGARRLADKERETERRGRVERSVYVDLNGVLDLYDGWKGPDHFPPPRPGAREFLETLVAEGFTPYVFTTMHAGKTRQWLQEHGLADLVRDVTNVKGPAVAYIDDRAIPFRGNFNDVLSQLRTFRAHWEPYRIPFTVTNVESAVVEWRLTNRGSIGLGKRLELIVHPDLADIAALITERPSATSAATHPRSLTYRTDPALDAGTWRLEPVDE